jgi:hypothetical protein
MEAAAVVLPLGGWVLYPAENESEISPRLRKRLIEEGLRLFPVSSVAEAVDVLFQKKTDEICNGCRNPIKEKNKRRFAVYPLFLVVVLCSAIGLALWKDGQVSRRQNKDVVSSKSNSGPEKDNSGVGSEKNDAAESEKKIQEEKRLQKGDHETMTNVGALAAPATIDIYGKTSLNAQISQKLADKLRQFFAEKNHHLRPVGNVKISGQVYVLKIEETWVEEQGNFKSNLKVVVRDFAYKDGRNTLSRSGIEADAHGAGMVEDVIPVAAQQLMNKILDLLPSKEKTETDLSIGDERQLPDKQSPKSAGTGFD